MKLSIIEHLISGRLARWCTKCYLHVDEKGEIDLDYYTARQYLKYLAVPLEQRCDHTAKEKNGDLIDRLDHAPFGADLRGILKEIIQRIP